MRRFSYLHFHPDQLLRRLTYGLGITALTFMIALFALLWSARAAVRPAPGDWITTEHAGPLSIEVRGPHSRRKTRIRFA